MNVLLGIIVFSILLATAYGVVFSIAYPLISMSSEIVTLCAVLGLATSLVALSIWKQIAN
jgi:hypothetical protein